MRKLKTFFRTLVLSSISPAYYNDVVRAPAWFSWQYFIGFQFFSAIIETITFGFALSHINITQIQQNLLAIYPQNLELSLKDGKLSINKPLPYYIPYPEGTNEPNGSSSRFIAFQKINMFQRSMMFAQKMLLWCSPKQRLISTQKMVNLGLYSIEQRWCFPSPIL